MNEGLPPGAYFADLFPAATGNPRHS